MNLDVNKQKAVAERFARLSCAYQKYPEYQAAGNVFVCYETIRDEIRRFCTQIVKKYDLYNVFSDGANCTFSSQQTIDEKYKGNMYSYYHG